MSKNPGDVSELELSARTTQEQLEDLAQAKPSPADALQEIGRVPHVRASVRGPKKKGEATPLL